MAKTGERKELPVKARFDEVCGKLNMDETTANNAWETYERINGNYSLEGDGLHWLACGLYLSGRRSILPTVDEKHTVKGNCVSLTILLRDSNLSLIHFFQKMKKWLDMTNSEDDFRKKIELLERNFSVVTVIFKKYETIFFGIFKSTPVAESTKTYRPRKQRNSPCTVEKIFNFCWTLYVLVKGSFPAISDDLVNSYHLLLCCLDLFYSNTVTTRQTKDMINSDFEATISNLNGKESTGKSSTSVPCIVEYLCNTFDGLKLEAKQIREHHWKPYIEKLFKKKILRGKEENLGGLLDPANFEANCKTVSNEYETYVLSSGDFDERIFLRENAEAEIGTPRKSCNINLGNADKQRTNFRPKKLEEHFSKTKSLAPQTPLTGRRYLKDKDPNVTPVSTATQSVSRLQTLLAGFKSAPSERLEAIFKECSKNPQQEIVKRVQQLGDCFSLKYTQPSSERPDSPGSTKEFADNRLKLAVTLYYKTLESITIGEKKRLQGQLDLTTMLGSDVFHRSLLACCLEIVIFSYNSQRTFPWILEVYELSMYLFYKVIEVLIRAEDGLSRDVVKHLNYIEEQILETLAWQRDSPLWLAISGSSQIPSCEDVTVHIEPVSSQPSVLSSPIIHPRVQRITGEEVIKRGISTPTSPSVSAHDRFSSPIHPSSARRNLFTGGSGNSAMTAVQKKTLEINPIKVNQPLPAAQPSVNRQATTCIPVKLSVLTTNTTNGSPIRLPLTSPVKMTSAPATPDKQDKEVSQKPKKTGSLALFFRKVYHLVSVRLRDLCLKLNIKEDLRRMIWTCFEHCLINSTDLMKDRHLDQILMCSMYVMGKVTNTEIKFQDIMRHYRTQPQAASHVYRNVLLRNKKKKSGSTSSNDSTKVKSEPNSARASPDAGILGSAPSSRSASPQIRSASATPSTPPLSLTATNTTSNVQHENSPTENERGDLIEFYNKIFIKKIKSFAIKFSGNDNTLDAPPLSPLPVVRNQPHSPRRRVSSSQQVYISPRKNGIPLACTSPRISYSFKESTSENLQNINTLLKNSSNGQLRKRALLLGNEDDEQKPAKQAANDEWMARRTQGIRAERETSGKR